MEKVTLEARQLRALTNCIEAKHKDKVTVWIENNWLKAQIHKTMERVEIQGLATNKQ